MAIIAIPTGMRLSNTSACSICGVKLTLNKATVGLVDADNVQAIACVSHLSEVELLINGWAAFMAGERLRYTRRETQTSTFIYEGQS
jgi:hypothetical protein